ncbi:MAG: ABC transporter substrate-binding protein [Magnetovibrio sp.]|nr:ABC transporter substrate-binding protein [Magnetovibrio sp.]
MTDLALSLGCWDYDRCRPVLDGRVAIDGVELAPNVLYPTEIFARAFTEAPFDISELSASSYVYQTSSGDCPYVAIPVFVSRAFRHGGIYVRADSGIKEPKDLEGRAVGVPEYQMTMALWARGILADEYGVDFRKLKYRTAGTNEPGRKERLPLALPDHMDVAALPETESLNGAMLAGRLDAMISPMPPTAFTEGDPRVRRLFADPVAEERAYFRRTGLFPIMHLIGVRKTLLAERPGLGAAVHRAFVEARRLAMDELARTATASANRLHLPWLAAEWETTRALMGDDYWPYGVAENRRDLEALCRYSSAQYLSGRQLDVEELFDPETLELSGT